MDEFSLISLINDFQERFIRNIPHHPPKLPEKLCPLPPIGRLLPLRPLGNTRLCESGLLFRHDFPPSQLPTQYWSRSERNVHHERGSIVSPLLI